MPRFLAFVLVLLLTVVPVGAACGCQDKPAKRARTKNKETVAAARLKKAKALLGAGKRQQAIRLLQQIIRRYPKSKTGLEARIILEFAE